MIRIRVIRLPVVTVMGMLALEAGVDPARFFEMTLPDFVALIRSRWVS